MEKEVRNSRNIIHENYLWYCTHYYELSHRYGNCFIVIKDKSVLGVYPTSGEAYRNTVKTEQLGTFNIQECRTDRDARVSYIYTPGMIVL